MGRESVYRKLKIGTNRFCQFRLAFDAHEPKQAKGALKAMSDRVADRLGSISFCQIAPRNQH